MAKWSGEGNEVSQVEKQTYHVVVVVVVVVVFQNQTAESTYGILEAPFATYIC